MKDLMKFAVVVMWNDAVGRFTLLK